ncbi:MAG: CinA family nicotinamide mononucleotide deamidase-related protein [Chloroflexota bacterium]
MNAEIIAIGTELLLGEIGDTNTRAIARALRDLGLDVFRTVIVGDNLQRIADAVRESLARSQVVITTGGLGPTVDDPTRQAIALALGVSTEFRPELWQQIQERFARFGRTPSENNRRQAFVPVGAKAVENPVGTAPAFIVERGERSIISLPGVPEEMAALLEGSVVPYLRERFGLGGVIHTRVLHTAGLGESLLDERIQDFEQLTNPTVGLSAHAGRVDVRITAKAESLEQAEAMIRPIEMRLRERLGEAVFGADGDSLEAVTLQELAARGWSLTVVESGTGGAISAALAPHGAPFLGGEVLPAGLDEAALRTRLAARMAESGAQAGVVALLASEGSRHRLVVILQTPDGERRREWSYGGAPRNLTRWATSLALDWIRRQLRA